MKTAQNDHNVQTLPRRRARACGLVSDASPVDNNPVLSLLADNDASLRKWSIWANFDSATLCQKILLDGRKLMEKCCGNPSGGFKEMEFLEYTQWEWVACMATGDPRLKWNYSRISNQATQRREIAWQW
jgi:hypothetical protein